MAKSLAKEQTATTFVRAFAKLGAAPSFMRDFAASFSKGKWRQRAREGEGDFFTLPFSLPLSQENDRELTAPHDSAGARGSSSKLGPGTPMCSDQIWGIGLSGSGSTHEQTPITVLIGLNLLFH